MAELTKKDLVKNWLLGYSSETCYNYERLQGLGNTNAFMPIIRALYPKERQAEELKKYKLELAKTENNKKISRQTTMLLDAAVITSQLIIIYQIIWTRLP